MHPDGGLDVVTPVPVGRDLKFFPVEGDAVVTSDAPFVLFAQDVVEVGDDTLDEGRPFFQGRLAKLGVVIPCSASSFGSRSWWVRNARSMRPLASGE